jgi:hypothetical protein
MVTLWVEVFMKLVNMFDLSFNSTMLFIVIFNSIALHCEAPHGSEFRIPERLLQNVNVLHIQCYKYTISTSLFGFLVALDVGSFLSSSLVSLGSCESNAKHHIYICKHETAHYYFSVAQEPLEIESSLLSSVFLDPN